MTKFWALVALIQEALKVWRKFLQLKKDREIDKAIETKGGDIEQVLDSKSAGDRSKFSGADGVFYIEDEN